MELTEAKLRLIDAARKGEVADYSARNSSENDPVKGPEWDDGRTIHAETIYVLATRSNPAWPVHAKGVRVRAARVKGSLDFTAAEIRVPLVLTGCYLDEAITLTDASARTITLTGTHLSGIRAEHLTVDGSVFFDQGFTAKGVVSLAGATIDSQLLCTGGTFENGLNADRLKVGNVRFDDGFTAKGEVSLVGAEIDGQLICTGGSVERGLSADGLKVDDVFLDQRFKAKGDVRLVSAEIGAELNCSSEAIFEGNLDLREARAGTLADDHGSWPKPGKLLLDGFEYVFSADPDVPRDAQMRLSWIELGPEGPKDPFLPQPYEQLVKVLRAMGDEAGVRKVSIRKQWRLRKRGRLGFSAWLGNWFLYLTVGYGYRAWLPLVWAVAVVVVGAFLFRPPAVLRAADLNVPAVTSAPGAAPKKPVAQSAKSERRHPVLYSIDVFLPFADLQQKKTWRLDESNGYFRWYEGWYLFEELAGWVLTALLAAAATGLLKK